MGQICIQQMDQPCKKSKEMVNKGYFAICAMCNECDVFLKIQGAKPKEERDDKRKASSSK